MVVIAQPATAGIISAQTLYEIVSTAFRRLGFSLADTGTA